MPACKCFILRKPCQLLGKIEKNQRLRRTLFFFQQDYTSGDGYCF